MKDNKLQNEIIIYEGDGGQPRIEVRIQDETVWLTQDQMADLFQKGRSTVAEHIQNAFKDGELDENSVCRESRRTGTDGKEYTVKHYNLDVIISVGYRVKSVRGTQFRQWATARLREYIVKGFTMDDERLKNLGGGNYWKELLDRIRDIRSSEKVLYRQVLDLYATSMDYNAKASESVEFFKIVQNKLHYAAHGHTAAEVIAERADAGKPFMGLLHFSEGGVVRNDVAIAKNYLHENELKVLNNIVSAFFDLAEVKAMGRELMHMKDWIMQLDRLIRTFDKNVLTDAGTTSHEQAVKKAESEYRKYQEQTLSNVECAYLEHITAIEKKVGKNLKTRKKKK